MAPAPSVVRLVDRLEKLRPQLRVILIVAAPERGPGARVALADAAHLRAQMHRVQVHRDAMGLQDANQLVDDLHANPLLDREPASEYAHQPRELGDADDLLVRDVADI